MRFYSAYIIATPYRGFINTFLWNIGRSETSGNAVHDPRTRKKII